MCVVGNSGDDIDFVRIHAENVFIAAQTDFGLGEGSGSQVLPSGQLLIAFDATLMQHWVALYMVWITGALCHAEGHTCTAGGTGSHAEGVSTTAHGKSSHAEGKSIYTYSEYSYAEGKDTKTYGTAKHAEGFMMGTKVLDTNIRYFGYLIF